LYVSIINDNKKHLAVLTDVMRSQLQNFGKFYISHMYLD
jgi:hypothetical protein